MAANERADGVQRLQACRTSSESVMALTPMSDSSERAFTFVADVMGVLEGAKASKSSTRATARRALPRP